MTNNTDLKLFQGNEEFDASLMKSILLFSEFGQTDRSSELMPQVILSLIIKEDGQATLNSIVRSFNVEFKTNFSNKDIKKVIDNLAKNKLITFSGENIIPFSNTQKGKDFFQRLSNDTDLLIGSILKRYGKLSKTEAPYPNVVKKNITDSLSLYLRLTSLQIVNEEDLPSVSEQTIKCAVSNVSNEEGSHIIEAIADTISDPTNEEKTCLNKWAKAYLLTQALKLDPTLANFKANIIKQKTFVLDTDVVLHLLCTHASHSSEYHKLINRLRAIGCKIYIPQDVIREVEGSAKQAMEMYHTYGTQIDQFTTYELRGSRSNVFIEDYVMKKRAIPALRKMNFITYIQNIYYKDHPEVLESQIKKAIGEENAKLQLENIELDNKVKEDLKQSVKELAEHTAKGTSRSENVNDILSDSDTKIYLTLKALNEGVKGKGLLKFKYYLLTQSRRTVKAAQQKGLYDIDIICRPETVGVVLDEVGYCPGEDISLINIFDNPYLVHAADEVWGRIKPVLDKGFQVSFMEFERLKVDVDRRFDEFLLSNDPNQRINLAKEYRDLGYPFAEQFANMADDNEKLRMENEQIPILKTQLNKFKGENTYLKKVSKTIQRNPNLKSRKKSHKR